MAAIPRWQTCTQFFTFWRTPKAAWSVLAAMTAMTKRYGVFTFPVQGTFPADKFRLKVYTTFFSFECSFRRSVHNSLMFFDVFRRFFV